LIRSTFNYDGIFDERAVPELEIVAPLMVVLCLSPSQHSIHLKLSRIQRSCHGSNVTKKIWSSSFRRWRVKAALKIKLFIALNS
jgi:hypothetical protein